MLYWKKIKSRSSKIIFIKLSNFYITTVLQIRNRYKNWIGKINLIKKLRTNNIQLMLIDSKLVLEVESEAQYNEFKEFVDNNETSWSLC